jgi:hypothetical protein
MKAPSEQDSIFTQDESTEAAWQILENHGSQEGRVLERVLKAEQHEIAEAAWKIWEDEGRQDGRALEYYLRAEQQFLAQIEKKTMNSKDLCKKNFQGESPW